MRSVVVVGGGAAGVLAAAAPAAVSSVDRIVLVERGPRVGPGLAYGAAAPHHLLNSPAGRMSAFAEDDGHFVDWCGATGTPVSSAEFVPRRRYGDYLAGVADGLLATDPGRVSVVRDEALRLEADEHGVQVVLRRSAPLPADHAVLALGNPPPVGRSTGGAARVVADPWAPGALGGITGSVLLLGTGLTAVDVATALARRDPDVRMTATSRHLLLPRTHLPAPAPAGPGLAVAPRSLGGLLTAFTDRLRTAEQEGRPWQAEVDGLRPQINGLWALLSAADRRRFVDRVSRVWEVHRHRMPVETAAELDALRATGRLRIERVTDPTAFETVIDATGPRPTAARGWSPVVDALLEDGLARPDGLGIGLDTDVSGALRDAHGRPSSLLHVLGPARRGSQWESTAIPEIRQQAVRIAERLARR